MRAARGVGPQPTLVGTPKARGMRSKPPQRGHAGPRQGPSLSSREASVRASDWGHELKAVVAIFNPAVIVLFLLTIAVMQ